MTIAEYKALPKLQRQALRKLYRRSGYTAAQILAIAHLTAPGDYVAVYPFHGVYVGIEPDGYTHT
jgi:hypothetical protein